MKAKVLILIYLLAKLLFLAVFFTRLEGKRMIQKARKGH
jgi:hypothetical protein